MSLALDLLAWALIVLGSVFCVIGGLGIVRFPDFYTRVHAAGVTDSLGATLVLFGCMAEAGLSQVTLKLMLVLFFLLVTSPTATHALVKAAYAGGLKLEIPRPATVRDPDDAAAGPEVGVSLQPWLRFEDDHD
ncbi:MAG TPA: monovalent cation/H(+) antiporter subunit G [Thermoanaerobaculia bacterium]|nr:monovalent cation/H(+) antiporter subunit G [Thermoanaerobaculia bacterium]